ncbi:cytochrome c peroxidase [Sedimenticola sp.]|uniref:cytochrome c peroxidase n=1 Tax=Sedimenticola sp. TaxID=1940285 RepID=UPI003D0DAE98
MLLRCLMLFTVWLWFNPSAMADTTHRTTPLAVGYGGLGYPLPAVGSYSLPSLGTAADGTVLDAEGRPQQLHDLFADKYVLLGFIYSRCSDVNGCPLTAHVFYQIKSAMQEDTQLADRLKLISLSFDPESDTPEAMQRYANNFRYAGSRGDWQFITTVSEKNLDPILDAYHQPVQPDLTSDGNRRISYSHLLRVYLIDPEKRIRNIYSVGFLHQALVLNDIKTLLKADPASALVASKTQQALHLSQPGDDKTGYEKASYTTRSRALEMRRGKQADLLQPLTQAPLGLPPIPEPADNPITRDKVALGRKLFFDRRLSLNDTFSCAMCHIPEQGFTSNELAMAVGVEGRSVRRNSPTIYNTAYAKLLFHDGREDSLEQQVWGPLLAKNEMANPSVGYLLNKIRHIGDYQALFETAFNGKGISMETLGQALASYQRTLVSADSAFDRWHYGRDSNALLPQAQQGYALFTGKAGCVACHRIGERYALFTDHSLHNTGVGYRQSMGIRPAKESVQIAPGVRINIDRALIERVGEQTPADVGRYEVTQNPHDRWKYKTPSLRNIALTAPYMHNGSLSTLRDVVEFYNNGGVKNERLDPLIKPLQLTEPEKQALVAFLQSLTGSNVDRIVADAFAAPIGDPNPVHGTRVEVR